MTPDNNLLAWKVISCIGHGGGVKRASIALGLDQSQCTRLLQNLEAELGVALTDHDIRPVGLNALGRRVLPLVEQMVESHSRLRQVIDDVSCGSLKLFIAIPANTPRESSLRACVPMMPSILICTSRSSRTRIMKIFTREGGYCLPALYAQGLVGSLHSSFGRNLERACRSSGYLASHGMPQDPSDLAGHVIFLRGGRWYPQTQHLERGIERAPLVFKRALVGDALTCRQAVLSGAGIALDLAYAVVKSDVEAGNLVPVLRGWHRPQWLPSIVFLATHPQRARIEKFVDFFVREESAALEKRLQEVNQVLGMLASSRQ